MTFERSSSDVWHREIPGARWFKADLHLHTVDDHPGKRAKWPAGINGNPDDTNTLQQYARGFLQGAVAAGIQVLGLTPHSPRAGTGDDTSAVWYIVETWSSENDDDGVPFRDKIYAVFPGFEPSFREGREGLHLLFLFDPAIGKDRYFALYNALMGGVSTWSGNQLNVSNLTAEKAFTTLRSFCDRECRPDDDGVVPWSVLILAPHIDASKGLFGAEKAQILQLFAHQELAGLELKDNQLPKDQHEKRDWLAAAMERYRHAFFHASDAYTIAGSQSPGIGHRYTWLKLASPRIEALRQAFIAADSRLRIAYERGSDVGLREIERPPYPPSYPWLRSVTVRGEASFFGCVAGDQPDETTFDLSPDLTCLIGGSMTGKSTLLDGLRIHLGAAAPSDRKLVAEVEERGRNKFLAGSPDIGLNCPGTDPTASDYQRWPAQFFTQGELQRLYDEPAAVEGILSRLVQEETQGIVERKQRQEDLSRQLGRLVAELSKLDHELDESEQAFYRAKAAGKALDTFAEAGVAGMHATSAAREVWAGAREEGRGLARKLDALIGEAQGLPELTLTDELAKGIGSPDASGVAAANSARELLEALNEARSAAKRWLSEVSRITEALGRHEKGQRREVEQTLAAQGLDAQKLREFEALSQQATLLPSFTTNLDRVRQCLEDANRRFAVLLEDRAQVLAEQRLAFDRVTKRITAELSGGLKLRRVEQGGIELLHEFLLDLQQRGVTRWWNSLREQHAPEPPPVTPDILLKALEERKLDSLGMSEAVASTFEEAMTRKRRRELQAVHCPDLYIVEMAVGDGEYRRIDKLSGGRRVSLLLSLLLETQDDRPLVVDQPEDELDNAFLWETVLPALRRLKGRRQVIVATHNANIVVNGDADQVILLEADAHRGRVAVAGAIEDPRVRDAIVKTVDGGREAFRLRRLKYGF